MRDTDDATRTLWRPVGPAELALVEASGWTRFPPRLPDQPIFYPVRNERYAREIAERWNDPRGGGAVLRFRVRRGFLEGFPPRVVGRAYHDEHWIPAERMDDLNAAIVGPIEVVSARDDHGARGAYAVVAPRYAEEMLDELRRKPLDRALLDVFADRVRGRGRVADLGTGPGQVARYLHDRGVEVEGVDLSPAMLAVARAAHPTLRFAEGDLRALPYADGALAGATAFYAIVHLTADELSDACAELARALAPGAPLLLSFHLGDERVHLDAWWERPVQVDFFFHPRARVEEALRGAGFAVEACLERAPDPAVEHPTTRCYLLARGPGADGLRASPDGP